MLVVKVRLEGQAFEDIETLVEELPVEHEPHQPESPVLFEDLFVNPRRNLNLAVNRHGQSANVEEIVRCSFVSSRAVVHVNLLVVVSELVELLLVNEIEPLVDEDVRILRLVSPLVVDDLLHGWVVGVLLHLRLPVLVFPAKSLLRNQLRIEESDLSVVEFVPFALFVALCLLSVLDERVVVPCFGCAVVHDDSLELVFIVVLGHCAAQEQNLV